MKRKILYLYHGCFDKIDLSKNLSIEGVYFFHPKLVGVNVGVVDREHRYSLVGIFALKEFEVEQCRFCKVIKMLAENDSKITEIVIPGLREADIELKKELDDAIKGGNYDEAYRIVEECGKDNFDVKSIEFFSDAVRIRFTNLAEVDVDAYSDDLNIITNNKIIHYLAGVI